MSKNEIRGKLNPSAIAATSDRKKSITEDDWDLSSSINVYSPEMLKELDKHNKAVRSALVKMDIDIEKAAINLYWIYSTKAYKAMGHESIIDYAISEFDFSKSTTYSFISLVERFGHRGEDGKLLLDGFDKKYIFYTSSKLTLLAGLTDEEIETLSISPEMSVRDIKRKLKRAKEGYEKILIPSKPSSFEPFKEDKFDDTPADQHLTIKDMPETENQTVFLSDNETHEDKTTDYVSEKILDFNKEWADDCLPLPDGKSRVIVQSCIDALKIYPDAVIEIYVRYPVT